MLVRAFDQGAKKCDGAEGAPPATLNIKAQSLGHPPNV